MKTKERSTTNYMKTTALMAALLFVFGCASQANDKAQVNESATIQTKVKAPETTMHTAALFGDVKTVKQHIAAGTDFNAKDDYGSTPLTIAATFGKTEVARVLIDAGADLNATNNDGCSWFHL